MVSRYLRAVNLYLGGSVVSIKIFTMAVDHTAFREMVALEADGVIVGARRKA